MHYHSRSPCAPLDRHVARLWHINDRPPHPREAIVPSGTIELVINLRCDEVRISTVAAPRPVQRFAGAVVSGPYRAPFAIDPAQHAAMMGVHFRPGGAFRFLGVTADELADRHVALETLTGSEAIRAIAAQAGLSTRRFIEVFTRQVGLGPKMYSRIIRFQRTIAAAGHAPETDWARLAAGGGYFDQSHLIREFQSIANLSPQAFMRQRSARVMENHAPLGRQRSLLSNTGWEPV